MRLYADGHDARYALEQIMLALFPEERVEFVESLNGEEISFASSRASFGAKYVMVITTIRIGGGSARASARAVIGTGPAHEKKSRLNYAVKRSFYRAAQTLTGASPPWGALTGIRPAKIATKLVNEGRSIAETKKLLQSRYFVSPERAGLCMQASRQAQNAARALAPQDISLYVGIPFCPSRCVYCSFVSNSVEKSGKLIPDYLEALDRETEAAAQIVARLGLRIRSAYIGGGTPTTLSTAQLEKLLAGLQSRFDLSAAAEFTVEAGRPDTVDEEKLAVLRRHGVTRVSVNPQSMQDKVLEVIGRRHSARDVLRAYSQVREAGFVVNMDTIAGLPGDSEAGFAQTIGEVIKLQPENIMVHTLAIKKGAKLAMGGYDLPGAQEVGRMIDEAARQLSGAGYEPYYLYRQKFMSGSFENTGWCLPGTACLYNIYIMEELHTILSLGAGGVTKLVDARAGYISRSFNPKYPQEYIAGIRDIVGRKEQVSVFYQSRNLTGPGGPAGNGLSAGQKNREGNRD